MPLTRNPTLPLPKELVGLTANERTELNDRIRTGKPAASVLLHARLVLKADAGADGPGGDDGPLAEAVACGPSPVSRLRPAVVEAGWPAALRRKQPTGRQYRQLDRVQAAPLIALACGAPPDGRTHWTLGCSPIGWSNWPWGTQSARKGCACPENNELHPWGRKPWLIPPQATAEYRFLPSDPRAGHRHVTVTEPRTAGDIAKEGRDLLQVRYPPAERVVLVRDNRNTHQPAARYQAVEPAVARALSERLELPYTPQHGRWLNRAARELSGLSRQGLDRRLPDADTLTQERATWEQAGNANARPVNWRFTTPAARIKLKRLYPPIQDG